jgi:5-methylcytosine-specific restriction endonuclease McrA
MVGERLNKNCLILNQNYEPLTTVNIKRAFILVYLGKAEVVEKYPFTIRTVSFSYVVPSVLRLLYFVHIKRPNLPLTKRNILRRDNYTCQYCGTREGPMTTDHVIPKRLGGEDTWENLVCACTSCNIKKGDRLPEAAKMKLIRAPKRPHFFYILHNLMTIPDEKWKQYLFLR